MTSELEKRNFLRLDFPLDVTVKVVPTREVPRHPILLPMKTRNISKGGICLETNCIEVNGIHLLSGSPFARENLLAMTIALIPGERPFQALGEVRWYDIARDIPGCLYRVGAVFSEVDDDGRSQLLRFLKDHRSERGFFENWLGSL